jgi:hypothetical protein
MVGAHPHIRVGEKDFQPRPPLAYIIERPGKGRGGTQAVLLEAPIHLGEEGLHVRLAVREAMKCLGFAGEFESADVVLDCVERADAPECLEDAERLSALGFNKLEA